MNTPDELEAKFWAALKSDMTLMLAVQSADGGTPRPMTAQLDQGRPGPIWFFTAKDTVLVRQLTSGDRAVGCFVAKDHDLFASIEGSIALETDRAMVDRLWNPFVAAWYEGGKEDPDLALLRLDPDRGEIWLNGSSLVAGIKMLLGMDPKRDYQNKVAKVDLRPPHAT